ncbi:MULTISPECIES: Gfo/Idh/MocA family protein [Paenibacillus]|uniref:Gfo/Idh/MocA family protein n=1 Tax=Paenibacillus TaxID=44249 RepID=UPI0022B8F51D|nr:Gfo/Idh/MocA family oxidoreductase [Paenibacillus caseinilyticus]MCZ8520455.1 Gfo/Idh/MocA family oxidoreductase [Paenibacillus caseinilyticus]
MSREIRIGLIGTGQIGMMHLAQYASIPGAQVVAVCDINAGEVERIGQMHGIAHRYTDYRQLLGRDDLDAVDVCLHNHLHAQVTIDALRAGKHVYCEKPIAGTYADGKAMCEAAEASGRMLHIQLGTLYRKETKAAMTLIDGGMLGRLYHARSNGFRRRNRPYVDGYGTPHFTRKATAAGGALMDMGVYHIAQMLYLLGNPEVRSISGKIYQETEMLEERRERSGFDVEELAAGFVKFEGGLTLDLLESWAVHSGGFEGSSIFGSKGGIRLPAEISPGVTQPFSFHSTVCDMDMDSTVDLDLMDLRWHRIRKNEDAYDSSQHHWIAALQGRVALLPTAEIALQTQLISEALYRSDRQGGEVTAVETVENSIRTPAGA